MLAFARWGGGVFDANAFGMNSNILHLALIKRLRALTYSYAIFLILKPIGISIFNA